MVFWSGVVGPGTFARSFALRARTIALRAHCRATRSKARLLRLLSKSNLARAIKGARAAIIFMSTVLRSTVQRFFFSH